MASLDGTVQVFTNRVISIYLGSLGIGIIPVTLVITIYREMCKTLEDSGMEKELPIRMELVRITDFQVSLAHNTIQAVVISPVDTLARVITQVTFLTTPWTIKDMQQAQDRITELAV